MTNKTSSDAKTASITRRYGKCSDLMLSESATVCIIGSCEETKTPVNTENGRMRRNEVYKRGRA